MSTRRPFPKGKGGEAGAERARRELARRHVVDFSEYVAPYYRAARHHRLVSEKLELVARFIETKGKEGIGRLLILEPPRHGKSEQVSRHFPAWVLGRLPDTRIILASYNADLATKFSRAARELVMGDRYRAVFGDRSTVETPVSLADDSRSVQAWDLAAPHRGGMIAAGVGGGITGMGADLLIIDDPFKNREEAESEARREGVWEWWTSTAYTRLEQGAAVIGCLTRWHADDWGGRLLKAMAMDDRADRWDVLSLPALPNPALDDERVPSLKGREGEGGFREYQRQQMLEGVWVDERDPLGREVGEALWPEKYDVADLERIRVTVGTYDFESLYQQAPFLRLGNIFLRENLHVVDEPPAVDSIVRRVRAWDKAGTEGGGDYSVGVLMCVTKLDVVYVEHVVRGQWSPAKREEKILETAREDANRKGPMAMIWHQKDPGSAGKDSAQATSRMLAKFGFTARFSDVTGEKTVRAGPWATAVESGGVRLLRGGWNEAFIEEHVAFPKGKYDDQVDTSSDGYNKLIGRAGKKKAGSYQG